MRNKGYFIGLGSNIDPTRSVPIALGYLRDSFGMLEVSRIVRTAPTAGLTGQFLNAVIYLQAPIDGTKVKSRLCGIEAALGRDRADPQRARKDRAADLDILLEVSPEHPEINAENLPVEPYYRSSMLELIKTMGLACPAEAAPVWDAAELSFSDLQIGLRPVRLLAGEGPGLVQERRAALVTGAAVRLGNAMANMLAGSGFDVALHYNSSGDAAEAAADHIRSLGVRCELFKQDLGDCAKIPALMGNVLDRFPHLDVLINSASVYEQARIAETTPEMLDEQWKINFQAPFFLIKEFAGRVEHGSIINLIDNKIAFNQYQYAAYLTSKKALAELTRMAALEFAPRIRVNGVAPGVVLPAAEREPSYLDWRKQTIPTRKLGNPSQICAAVDALLRNEFINGQVMFVDGGEAMNFIGRNLDSYGAEEHAPSRLQSVSPTVEVLAPYAA